MRIQIFVKALYLTLTKGPGNITNKEGRAIHYKTEHTIKLNAMLIVRDILRSSNHKNKYIKDEYASLRNFIIWKVHILTYEVIHFCVLFDFYYGTIASNNFKKKILLKTFIKRFKILRNIILIYLPFKIIYLNLVSIKSNLKNKSRNSFITKHPNTEKPKWAVLLDTGLSLNPRHDLHLYKDLKHFGISKNSPIVVFLISSLSFKEKIRYKHKPGYIFCQLPKQNFITLSKIIKYVFKNIFSKNFNFWLIEFFQSEFKLADNYIKKSIDKFNIKLISLGDSFEAERNIFKYSSESSSNKIKLISRERSVWDIHDKWTRNFVLTDFYLAITKRDLHIATPCKNKFLLNYKINLKNYKKYSSKNTRIASCKKKILILTSNLSINKNPFGQQKIHESDMEIFLNILLNYLINKKSLGIVFKCKKIQEYRFLNEWRKRNKIINKQIDIILPSRGIPLLEMTNGYHEFIALTPFCAPSTIFELSCLIPKSSLHFIDFAGIYNTPFYLNTNSGKRYLDKLPFMVHKNITNLLDELNNKDLSLKRKFSLQEYNDKCNKLNTIFLKRLKNFSNTD